MLYDIMLCYGLLYHILLYVSMHNKSIISIMIVLMTIIIISSSSSSSTLQSPPSKRT